jgi:hypothetical protein
VHPPLDPLALGVQDALEALVDVVQHAVEVRVGQLLLPLCAQALEDASQAGDVAAACPAQSALHQLLQGSPDVALGEDVLAERIEHVVRVE